MRRWRPPTLRGSRAGEPAGAVPREALAKRQSSCPWSKASVAAARCVCLPLGSEPAANALEQRRHHASEAERIRRLVTRCAVIGQLHPDSSTRIGWQVFYALLARAFHIAGQTTGLAVMSTPKLCLGCDSPRARGCSNKAELAFAQPMRHLWRAQQLNMRRQLAIGAQSHAHNPNARAWITGELWAWRAAAAPTHCTCPRRCKSPRRHSRAGTAPPRWAAQP